MIGSGSAANPSGAESGVRCARPPEFQAVHLNAQVSRIAVYAEAFAIGMGVVVGDATIEMIVAVDRDGSRLRPTACVASLGAVTK